MRRVELRSGTTGRFEVSLDGDLVFSKAALKRHAAAGEVAGIFEQRLGPPPPPRHDRAIKHKRPRTWREALSFRARALLPVVPASAALCRAEEEPEDPEHQTD